MPKGRKVQNNRQARYSTLVNPRLNSHRSFEPGITFLNLSQGLSSQIPTQKSSPLASRSPNPLLRATSFLTATVAHSEFGLGDRHNGRKQLSNGNTQAFSTISPLHRRTRGTPLVLALALVLFAAPLSATPSVKSACDVPGACPCAKVAALSAGTQHDPQNLSGQTGSMQMPGMSSSGMHMSATQNFIEQTLNHESAGTSAEPNSTPHDMLMSTHGPWTLMFHGEAFLNSIQQTGPRGADKVFSTSWLMPMAQRSLGPGTLTVRGMFSLEPATITDRQYPELFQVGETAYGKPIVDGQHPHNFFMELALLYDLKLSDNALLSFYAAPVGDPAIGPEAYPHRVSASEDPLAALGHHLQDSTHISYDVVTVGLAFRIARLEFSGFHGREPGENRWTIGAGDIDSWATRLTLSPSANWSGQYSIARLKSPEQLFPAEDTLRMTASLMYNRPIRRGASGSATETKDDWGNWASTLVWGRNQDLPGGEVFNSYLAESTLRFARHNCAWTRIENVDRTNLLLLGENPLPPGFEEHFLARIQAYTLGYDREFDFIPRLSSALGGEVTLYGKPASLDANYGDHPTGVLVFLRLRPTSSGKLSPQK